MTEAELHKRLLRFAWWMALAIGLTAVTFGCQAIVTSTGVGNVALGIIFVAAGILEIVFAAWFRFLLGLFGGEDNGPDSHTFDLPV